MFFPHSWLRSLARRWNLIANNRKSRKLRKRQPSRRAAFPPRLEELEPYFLLSATLTWEGGSGNFNSSNWNNGTGTVGPTAGANYVISSGTVTLTASQTAGSLTLGSGATLINTGSLTVGAASTFSGAYTQSGSSSSLTANALVTLAGNTTLDGGTISAPSEATNVTNTGTLTVGGSVSLYGGLSNQGAINQTAGSLDLIYNNTVLLTNTSTGTYDIQETNSGNSVFSGFGIFENQGLLENTAGGVVVANNVTNSGGTIQAGSGDTLKLSNATYETGGTFSVSSGGIIDLTDGSTTGTITGTSTAFSSDATGTVQISSGDLNVGTGGANLISTTAGVLQWTGGTILTEVSPRPTLTIDSGSYLTLAGSDTLETNLDNQGTVSQSSGNLSITSGSTFTNDTAASYDIQEAGNVISGGGTFVNKGTLSLQTSLHSSITSKETIGGTVSVAAGADLDLGSANYVGGGSFLVASGAILDLTDDTNSGSISGTWTASGGGTVLVGDGSSSQLAVGAAGATLQTNPNNRCLVAWTGGILGSSSSGTLTVSTGTELDMNAPSQTLLLYSDLDNEGTINEEAGLLQMAGSVTLSNQGTFNIEETGTVTQYGTFLNEGTLNYSASGTATLSGDLLDEGAIAASAGTLELDGATFQNGGSFLVSNGAVVDLTGGGSSTISGTWSVTAGSGGGTVQMASGILNVASAGATFNAAQGTLSFSGGTLDDANGSTAPLTIGAGYYLTLAGNVSPSGIDLVNDGTIDQTAGLLNMATNATLTNTSGATFDIEESTGGQTNNNGTLLNEGTLEDTRTSAVTARYFTTSGGGIMATSGTLHLYGNTFDNGTTFAVSGGATIDLTDNFQSNIGGTSTITVGAGGGTVLMANGDLNLLLGGATLVSTTPGVLQWTGGTLEGENASPVQTLTLTQNSFLTLAGDVTLRGNLDNQGTINETSGQVQTYYTLTNDTTGTYNITTSGTVLDGGGGFVNKGLLTSNTAASTTASFTASTGIDEGTVDVLGGELALAHTTYTGGGAFDVVAGATLDLTDGSNNASMTGTWIASGGGTVILSDSSGQLAIGSAGATLRADPNSPGVFEWTGGTLGGSNSGTLTLSAGTVLDTDYPSNTLSLQTTLINQGTINAQAGTIGISGSDVLDNQGTFNISTTGTVTQSGTFLNQGTVIHSVSGTATMTQDLLDEGTINASAGTLELYGATSQGGGSFVVSNGAIVDLTGGTISTISGTWTATAGNGGGTVQMASGVLNIGSAGATFDAAPGVLNFSGGSIEDASGSTAALTIGAGYYLTLAGTASFFSNPNPILVNDGTINQPSGDIALAFDGVVELVNQVGGVYNVTATGQFTTDSGILLNKGTLNAAGGAAMTFNATLSNPGTVNVASSALGASSALTIEGDPADVSGSTLEQGTWNVSAGNSLTLGSDPALTAIGAAANVILSGAGSEFTNLDQSGNSSILVVTNNSGSFTAAGGRSFTLPGGFTNNGTLTAGPGSTITVGGSYTQTSSGTLSFLIGGSPSSGQYGQLAVTGSANLAGTLNATLVNSYFPEVGQNYTVMTFGSSTGTFTSFTGALADPPLVNPVFTATSTPTSLALDTDASVVPSIQGIANLTAGIPVAYTSALGDTQLDQTYTYAWSVTGVSGAAAGFVLPSSVVTDEPTFVFTPPQPGGYEISLTVTNSLGVSGTTSFLATASVPSPVVVISGTPSSGNAGSAVSLSSSVIEPTGATASSYSWSVTVNGQPYTLPSGTITNAPTFAFTPTQSGLYTVSLTVTDSLSGTSSQLVSFFVGGSPTAAIFGIPPSVPVGIPLNLTSAANNPDLSGPLTYTWTITGPNSYHNVQTNSSGLFTFTPALVGTYQAALLVRDANGNTASANPVTFNVVPTPLPVAITGAPSRSSSATVGSAVSLSSQVSEPANVTPTIYAWSVALNGNPYTLPSGTVTNASTFAFKPSTAGIYTVSLTVIDSAGDQGTATAVFVAQSGEGLTLSQTSPFTVNSSTGQMQAKVNDPASGVSYTYAWTVSGQSTYFIASGPGTSSNNTTSVFSFVPPTGGTYTVSVTANGSDGTSATASQVVTVAATYPTPTILGLPTSSVYEGQPLSLSSTVTEPGGSTRYLYQWTVTAPNGISYSGSNPVLVFTPNLAGSYTVHLTITDGNGDATTVSGTFTATEPPPPVPVIQSSAGAGVSGSTLTLNLAAQEPSAGSDVVYSYAWSVFDNYNPNSTNTPVATGSGPTLNSTLSYSSTDNYTVQLIVSDTVSSATAFLPILFATQVAPLTLTQANVPTGATEVLAIALGSAKIDGSQLPASVTQVQTALGGNDTLIGGAGPNILQGDSGDNSLVGGSGPNTLYATGGDTLIGGMGTNSNLFSIMPGAGESVTAGATSNTLSFAQATNGVSVNLTQNTGQTQTITSGSSLALTGSIQTLIGSSESDTLIGGNNSTVLGGGGNDTLIASGSNVALVAGISQLPAGSNAAGIVQFGGTGNDSLYSSGGSSITMVGGAGNSTLSNSGGSGVVMVSGGSNYQTMSSNGSSITMMGGSGNSALINSGGSSITMFGGSGNDSLYSSGGSSVSMIGGTGNDSLSSTGDGNVTLLGGNGNAVLTVSGGSSITMFGGSGNDSLYSSGGSSVSMIGGTGNDSLASSAGSSMTLVGGSGNSVIVSSGGSSITMFGGTGNDSLYSTGGSSISMIGGTGNDTIISNGSGNSTLPGSGASSITMFGGSGNDSLYSSGGSSVSMIGGSGNDTLSNSNGSSVSMTGGSGNSTLMSSGGSSITMFGGSGNDSLYSTGGSSVSMIGGTGNDTIISSGSGNSTLPGSGASSITMFGGSGNDSLYSSGGSSVSMVGGSGNDTLSSSNGSSVTMIGGSGNSTLASSGGSSITMFGGSGNDSLYSSGGSSVSMIGGTGDDTIISSGSGNSTLPGSGASSITMFGGSGNDSLYSSGGSSVSMVGGSGNDTLSSSNGSSVTMIGGSGNSTLLSSGGSSITMFGGSGNDSLYSSGGSSVSMIGGTGNDTIISSGSGNSTLPGSGASSITMFGGSGNDSLYSSGGSSVTMIGGSGNDTLSSTNGSSVLMNGGSGNSTLASSGGSSITMFGGTGNDSLYSSGGSSVTMIGGTGNDTLINSGGSGNTTLPGSGATSITMFGGTGNDSLYSSGGSSVTMIGGSGNDTLNSSAGTSISMTGGSGNSTLVSSGGSSITMFGGSGNDSLYSSGGSSVSMIGGTGNDTVINTGGGSSSITMFGGTGNDSLYSSGGSSVSMIGGTGNDSLSSTGGSSVTMIGGSGNSTLTSSGGSSITMFGGSGNDSLASSSNTAAIVVGGSGTDNLSSAGDSSALIDNGGSAGDLLSVSGGTSVSLIGGAGNDTLSANGGSAVSLFGLDGDNTYQLTGTAADPLSVSLNDLDAFGQVQSQTDDETQAINTILFPSVSGITLNLSNASTGTSPTAFVTAAIATPQQTATGLSLFLTGQFQNVIGTSGNDVIQGDASNNVLQAGSGNATLIGGTGSATLVAGSGDDSLVAGSGGTTFRFTGTSLGNDIIDPPSGTSNTLDFSQLGGAVNFDLSSTAAQTVSSASPLKLTLQNAAINAVVDSAYNDFITGNSLNDSFYAGSGNDTFTGGGGNDAYFFSGSQLGTDTINETTNNNTLNFLGLNAGVNLNLNQSSSQTLNSALTLNLPNPGAFTTVVGTPFDDTIQANNGNDTLIGAGGDDSLVAGSGNDYLQGYITQVVYLDFNEPVPYNGVDYTSDEISAIQQILQQDFADFNYTFVTDPTTAAADAAATGGQYISMEFNTGAAGGASSELDVDHLQLNGVSHINIALFLGSSQGLVPPTITNIENLTADITAHELGHLSGLQHQDAFGPIGSGIYSGVNPDSFYPIYTGPTDATETPQDIMASPASLNTTLADAAGMNGPTYFGERDDIKLAFADTGTILQQESLSTENVSVSGTLPSTAVLPPGTPSPAPFTITQSYVLPALPSLAVPNTLPSGVDGSGQTFNVTALAVNATLSTPTEQDFYAFQGTAGQLMNFQVISNNNTLNPNPILPELLLVGPTGQVLGYNVHEFESPDSSLYDITLPTTGTYYVGVDSLLGLTKGNYQLFMYSFATSPSGVPSTGGGDTLVGGSGNDTFVGSSGNDQIRFLNGSAGSSTVQSGSGQDVVSLFGSPREQVTAPPTVLIQAPTTTTTLTSSLGTSAVVYGQPVTFTATVAATATGQGTPTGTVSFYNGSTLLESETLASSGIDQVSITTSALPVGADSITAVYSGDTTFETSTSSAVTQTVNAALTTTTASNTAATFSTSGQDVTLDASVTSSAGTVDEGKVKFTLDNSSGKAIGTAASGSVTSNGSASVSYGLPAYTLAGSYTIVASYSDGAGNFAASSNTGQSPAPALTVDAATTTTTASDVTTTFSTSGQDVTLDASVTSSGGTVDEGKVKFTLDNSSGKAIGTAASGSVTSNGSASVSYGLPAYTLAGTYTIVASYSDSSGNFAAGSNTGQSPTPALTVNAATTTTTASAATATYITSGQDVTLDASMTSSGGTVDEGSVTFTIEQGTTVIGTSTAGTVSAGATSVTYALPANLTAGSYTIVANYSDSSGNFADSYDDSETLTVNAATTTTTASAATATYITSGQDVTLDASVTSSAGTVDEGKVKFTLVNSSGKAIGTAASGSVTSNGSASVSYGLPAYTLAGSYTIVASYSDSSGNFAASSNTGQSPTPALTVNAATTTTTASAATATYSTSGQDVTLDASVTSSGGTVDEGSVTFTIEQGTTVIGTSTAGTVSAGTASVTYALPANLVAGTYTIVANYSDSSGNFQASSDANQTPTPMLTINSNVGSGATITKGIVTGTQFFGQLLTFTATVTPATGSGTPTGSVDFYDATTQTDLGSVMLSAGSASLSTSALPTGTQSITLSYSGDAYFLASNNDSKPITVSPATSIYVLNSSAAAALSLSGNASLNVPGVLVVDSSSSSAVTAGGNANVSASSILIVGGDKVSGNASFSVSPVTGAASESNPLANLPVPAVSGALLSINLSGNSSQTIKPGVYSQINVSGNAKLTMTAGTYVLAGGDFSVTGNASVTGTGVAIYMASSDYPKDISGSTGGLSFSGNGTISLTAPTTGTYAGILIYQPSYNTRALSLSGGSYAGLNGGIIYAPSALLSVSGNAQIQHSSLVVGQLQLSGNSSSTMTADNADGSNNTAGQLLSSNLFVYVDNSSGYFTSDELASIQSVIISTDALVEPYGVSVTQVTDPTEANVVISAATDSPAGDASDGVLGCFTISTGQITILEGWSWYAGTDASAIGANQYSFTSTVTHELGHALGLGHSSDSSSVMYASIASGVVKGGLTTQDLNLPPPDESVDALHAAPPTAIEGTPIKPFVSAAIPSTNGNATSASSLASVNSTFLPAVSNPQVEEPFAALGAIETFAISPPAGSSASGLTTVSVLTTAQVRTSSTGPVTSYQPLALNALDSLMARWRGASGLYLWGQSARDALSAPDEGVMPEPLGEDPHCLGSATEDSGLLAAPQAGETVVELLASVKPANPSFVAVEESPVRVNERRSMLTTEPVGDETTVQTQERRRWLRPLLWLWPVLSIIGSRRRQSGREEARPALKKDNK